MPVSPVSTTNASEQIVELEPPPLASPGTMPGRSSEQQAARAARGASAKAAPRAARRAHGAELESESAVATADTSDGTAEPAQSAPEAAASTEAPAIDLGLDGHFFMRPSSEPLPRVHKSEFQHQLERSLSADDVRRGLARGNELLGSLSAAAREAGPTRGEALVLVTLGPDGVVNDVQLAQGSADEWSGVLRSFRALAARKRVRVPAGAHGLRVTFSVRAKVQRPSGKSVAAAPVGIADPSLAPNGLTLRGDFDVSDLAGSAQRLVYARVVSEEML